MGWAEKRVKEYNEGQKATWLERRCLEHANPLHMALGLIAGIAFVYGLWIHDWIWIIGGLVSSLAGHLYCWSKK